MIRIAIVQCRNCYHGPSTTTSKITSSLLQYRKGITTNNNYNNGIIAVSSRSLSSTWNWSKTMSPLSNRDNTNMDDGSISSSRGSGGWMEGWQREVVERVEELHGSIMPLNERLRGPLAQYSNQSTALPFVLLVGNHSSGKSSFINHVLGQEVQTAGVAPTDDCFTVICPGPENADRDGPALVGDPDMGFAPLRQFGPTLIHHSRLKIRSHLNTNNLMMIDTPGMIDSPGSSNDSSNDSSNELDRGYDFTNVVKWLGQRADVVLLFFDPDKPGTTGETLRVLTQALGGMDHKLLIVLNKADQFERIHDFARAYGSLCWNLSKVIPRKDLPRIYTMCLPHNNNNDGSSNSTNNTNTMGGLGDLHQTRDDVVAEVLKAPKRRIDNVISHLHDSVHLLLMHAKIVQDVQKQESQFKWAQYSKEIGSFTGGISALSASVYLSLPTELTGGIVAMTILTVGGLRMYHQSQYTHYTNEQLKSPDNLLASFQRTHARDISDSVADEYTVSIWQRIRDYLPISLNESSTIPKVSTPNDIQPLLDILHKEIPTLRRKASPNHYGSPPN